MHLVQAIKLNEEQSEAMQELKKSLAWEVIRDLIQSIILEHCSLEKVDTNLDSVEYKVECLSRKKARKILEQIFDDVKVVDNIAKQSQKEWL